MLGEENAHCRSISFHVIAFRTLMKQITYFPETIFIYHQIVKAGFHSDGVIVGVAIRSVEYYDMVKIKSMESEAEH